MAVEKFIATDNMNKIMSDETCTCIAIDPTLAIARVEDEEASTHVSDIIDELEDKAKDVIPQSAEEPKLVLKNVYTNKLVLDESVEDFSIDTKPKRVYDDDAFDTYWDMDMFDFVYELATTTDARRKPIDPLGRPHSRFAMSGRDRYAGLSSEQKQQEVSYEKETGMSLDTASQIGVGDDYIDLYAHNLFRFDDMLKICDMYKFKTEGPVDTYKTKRNKFLMTARDEWLKYEYMLRIYVPCEDGIPLRIEDYFDTLNLKLEDVMNPEFCRNYRKIQAKLEQEQADLLAKKEKEKAKNLAKKEADENDIKVEDIFKKYVQKASWSDEPLDTFIKDMFDELTSSNLNYSKAKLKQRFLDEFKDDFEEGLLPGTELANPIIKKTVDDKLPNFINTFVR